MRRIVTVALGGILCLACTAPAAVAAPFMVDSTADAVDTTPGDGTCASASNGCTLRAAIQETNALAGPDVISVPAGKYLLTITGSGEDASATGDLDVTGPLTLTGSSARAVTVTAKEEFPDGSYSGIDRIVDVISGGNLTMSKVSLDVGSASTGAIVRAAGATDFTDVMVKNGGHGGGIYATAPVSLNRVTVAKNFGSGLTSSVSATIVNSTFFSNRTTGNGGGLAVLSGTADVLNTTFVWNASGSSSVGGQIYNGGSVQLRNSIFERTTPSAPSCGGNPISSGGFNVYDDSGCAFNGPGDRLIDFYSWTHFEPANAGGETDVVLPFEWPSSYVGAGPAVDIGADSCPATDQRGMARPQGASCDAGAYEAAFADLVVTASGLPAEAIAGSDVSYTLTVRNNGPFAARPQFSGGGDLNAFSLSNPPGAPCAYYVDCTLNLGPGESATVEAHALLGDPPPSGFASMTNSYSNGAPIAEATLDPTPADATVTIKIHVLPKPVAGPAPTAPTPTLAPGACANIKPGTVRADTLIGTAAGDRIRGLAGNDKLKGLAGDDCLDGGPGSDTLDGGDGNDKLTGGMGADTIKGGAGNDVVSARDHKRDKVDCGKGRDTATVDRIDRVQGCEKVKRKR